MEFRIFLKAAATAALLSLVASCGGPVEPVIGVVMPETGRASRYGSLIREGMELALGHVNDGGGINDQPLRLIYEDSRTDPATGAAAALKLVTTDRVPAIIGAVSSSVTAQILDDVVDEHRVVLLSPASSSPTLTDRSRSFFRVYPSDTLEGARMVEVISSELRLRKMVVFAVNDQYGAGYKKGLIERYRRKKNRQVLKVFNYAVDQEDFSGMVAEAAQLDPEAVFLIGYVDMLVDLVRTIRDAGIEVPIFCSGSITADFPSLAGEAAEGIIYSRPDFRMIGNADQVSRFIEAFTAKYGREPEDYAAYGYDAVMILAQVMRQGNFSAADILLGLRSPTMEYSGVTGNIVFGNAGSDIIASPTTYIIHEGTAIPYKRYLEQGGRPPGSRAGAGS